MLYTVKLLQKKKLDTMCEIKTLVLLDTIAVLKVYWCPVVSVSKCIGVQLFQFQSVLVSSCFSFKVYWCPVVSISKCIGVQLFQFQKQFHLSS